MTWKLSSRVIRSQSKRVNDMSLWPNLTPEEQAEYELWLEAYGSDSPGLALFGSARSFGSEAPAVPDAGYQLSGYECITDGLQFYYNLNERGDDDLRKNSWYHKADLTPHGAVYTVNESGNNAVRFAGGYLRSNFSDESGLKNVLSYGYGNGYSVCFRVKIESGPNDVTGLVCKNSGLPGYAQYDFNIGYTKQSGNKRFFCRMPGGTVYASVSEDQLSDWIDVQVRVTPAYWQEHPGLAIRINGGEWAEKSGVVYETASNQGGDLFLGCIVPGSGSFRGIIDDVAIWNRALSFDDFDYVLENSAHYLFSKTCECLDKKVVAHYRFDEAATNTDDSNPVPNPDPLTTRADSSGNNLHLEISGDSGAIVGSSDYMIRGNCLRQLSAAPVRGYLYTPHDNRLNATLGDSSYPDFLLVSLFLKAKVIPSGYDNATIISKLDPITGCGYELSLSTEEISPNDYFIKLVVGNGDNGEGDSVEIKQILYRPDNNPVSSGDEDGTDVINHIEFVIGRDDAESPIKVLLRSKTLNYTSYNWQIKTLGISANPPNNTRPFILCGKESVVGEDIVASVSDYLGGIDELSIYRSLTKSSSLDWIGAKDFSQHNWCDSTAPLYSVNIRRPQLSISVDTAINSATRKLNLRRTHSTPAIDISIPQQCRRLAGRLSQSAIDVNTGIPQPHRKLAVKSIPVTVALGMEQLPRKATLRRFQFEFSVDRVILNPCRRIKLASKPLMLALDVELDSAVRKISNRRMSLHAYQFNPRIVHGERVRVHDAKSTESIVIFGTQLNEPLSPFKLNHSAASYRRGSPYQVLHTHYAKPDYVVTSAQFVLQDFCREIQAGEFVYETHDQLLKIWNQSLIFDSIISDSDNEDEPDIYIVKIAPETEIGKHLTDIHAPGEYIDS